MFRIFISGKSVFIEGQIAARDSPTFPSLLNSFDSALFLSFAERLLVRERFLRSSSLPEEAISRAGFLSPDDFYVIQIYFIS